MDKLMPLVNDELHRLAHRFMARERAGHNTLVLKVAPITVIRDWNMAKLWLLKELERG